jgi:hypothetical protein
VASSGANVQVLHACPEASAGTAVSGSPART